MKNFLFWVVIMSVQILFSQQTKRVLFIGNSYIYTNNLPQMVSNCATSTNDQLIYNSSAPGGHTFEQHSTNTSTLEKIQIGDWDFVVLQEQSQLPSFPEAQVAQSVYPFAHFLDSTIEIHNPCAKTLFYMTWGRKNGDAQNCPNWPPVCTYEGMDSLLNLRYMTMAEQNNAEVAPVGALWRHLREQNPEIDLYNSDLSHPSVAGTYAAACAFYVSIFRKDPTLITWNSTLSATDAAIIRNAAKFVVFDAMNDFFIGVDDPLAGFEIDNSSAPNYLFMNTSVHADEFSWFVNDVFVSNEENLNYTLNEIGSYNIRLLAKYCSFSSEFETTVSVLNTPNLELNGQEFIGFPNPFIDEIYIQTSGVHSIRIHDLMGKLVHETEVFSNLETLNLNFLKSGVYFISSNIGMRFKVIKN